MVGMDTIIGRSLALLNSARTLGSVRRRDDNSLLKVQNGLWGQLGFFPGIRPGRIFAHHGFGVRRMRGEMRGVVDGDGTFCVTHRRVACGLRM